MGVGGPDTPEKNYVGVRVCFNPLNVTVFHLDNSYKFHTMKDERLVSKMEGKTNFSRRLKQFDGLT